MKIFARALFALVILSTLVPAFAEPPETKTGNVMPGNFSNIEHFLKVIRAATFAKGHEVNESRRAVNHLPLLGPAQIHRALSILVSNEEPWRTNNEPRASVLSKIYSSVVALETDHQYFGSPLHLETGVLASRLLERFPARSERQRSIVELMNQGAFWTPRDLPFFLTQIKNDRLDNFAVTILSLAPSLSETDLAKLGDALISVQPRQALEYSMLYLLGIATTAEKSHLVRVFAAEYSSTLKNQAHREHFPVGALGLSGDTKDLALYLQTYYDIESPILNEGDHFSDACQITAAALNLIYVEYLRNDPETLAAVIAARNEPSLGVKSASSHPAALSLFFQKLATTGFADVELDDSMPYFEEDPNVIKVNFAEKARKNSCRDDLKRDS